MYPTPDQRIATFNSESCDLELYFRYVSYYFDLMRQRFVSVCDVGRCCDLTRKGKEFQLNEMMLSECEK
jgi:hypothetical protein